MHVSVRETKIHSSFSIFRLPIILCRLTPLPLGEAGEGLRPDYIILSVRACMNVEEDFSENCFFFA